MRTLALPAGAVLLLLMVSLSSGAEARSGADGLAAQRALFRSVDAALQHGDRGPFLSARALLRSYPLYPYLLYDDLLQRLDSFPAPEIHAFLHDYGDLPVAASLRAAWLRQLGQSGRWDEYLQDYQASSDITLACYYRQALLAKDRDQQALAGIAVLWLSGYSQPNACDPVFDAWRKQGGLTEQLIWRRFELAMKAGQSALGNYLQGLLTGNLARVASVWLVVANDPSRILDSALVAKAGSYGPTILHYGLRAWSNQDSVAAADAYDTLRARYRLPHTPEWDDLQRRLALFVASRGDPSALRRLQALPASVVDDDVAAWRVRVRLHQRDWPAVLQALDRMPAALAHEPEWRYWRGRALAATGQDAAARKIYRILAAERDFFGFLAAQRLGQPYALVDRATPRATDRLAALRQRPGIIRARELFLLDRSGEARAEWQAALAGADHATLQAAAWLAHGWGWDDRAIIALSHAGDLDDLTLRFPLPYHDQIMNYARTHAINPAWIYAVMRQESLFQTDARSSAGALGLMQLLPATGVRIAHALGDRWNGGRELLDPATNIRYGTYYLQSTLTQLQNNPLLATAAYNAGPQRVVQWLPQSDAEPADLWIETIPYYETRTYVKRVLEYAVVYAWRLDLPQPPLSQLMIAVQAPPAAGNAGNG